MKEFYVRLTSGASRGEFPLNKANSFRNRLPEPIRLIEPGWKVGMSALHVPKTRPKLGVFVPHLFEFVWHEDRDPDDRGNLTQNRLQIRTIDLNPFRDAIQTGTDLLNTVRHLYYKALQNQKAGDYRLWIEDGQKDKYETYVTFEKTASGNYLLDNSNVYTSDSTSFASIAIGRQLALDMGWIKRTGIQQGRVVYGLGPNLRKDFPSNSVPTATDVVPASSNPQPGDEIFFKGMPIPFG